MVGAQAVLKPNQGKGQHFIILTSPLHHEALIEIISIIPELILNTRKEQFGNLLVAIFATRIKAM